MSFWTQPITNRAISLFREGKSDRQIAAAIGATRDMVCSKRHRDRWALQDHVPTPIRPSMRRLAEFDPVVRRALEEREAA